MSLVIDIILIVLIGVIVINAGKKGFASTLVDTFSIGISGFTAYHFAPSMSEWAYDLFVRDLVKNNFEKVLDDMSGGVAVNDKIYAMIESLPASALNLSEAAGFNIHGSINSLLGVASMSNDELINFVAENIGYKIMFSITQICCFFILFIIVAILLKFVSSFLTFINNIPLIGKINSLLGGIFGLVKAAVLICVITTVIFVIATVSDGNGFAQLVDSSKIYNYIIEYNPIIDLIY